MARALLSCSLSGLGLCGLLILSCGDKDDDTGTANDDLAPAGQGQDSDGDGILDEVEGQGDTDGDGVPDHLDTDTDGDCIPDAIERGPYEPYSLPIDSDLDGQPDYKDLDSDDNSLLDRDEAGDCQAPVDLDGDGDGDWRDLDDDGDTILDVDDGLEDADGDGVANHRDTDSDGDCIPDAVEAGDEDPTTPPRHSDLDGLADFLDTDSDNDGLSDTEEVAGSCTEVADTDGDQAPDYVDDDIDGDGLLNVEEEALGTDPWDRDSDADGYTDGLEVYAETNPLESASVPRGTVIETGPRQVSEHEGEYVLDEYKLDIYVLLDTAYSYSCYHPNLEAFIEELVDALFAEFEDVAIGFGTYDDYRWASGWASSQGSPYELQHQVSTNHTSVKRAAEGQQMIYGGDDLGSAYEALYQSATGHGYDQVCDQVAQDKIDILPFISAEDDAFDGAVSGTYRADVAGSGTRGGAGFRSGSSPIIILTADNSIRNEDVGHAVPSGTCDQPASFEMAMQAINELRARVLGINVYEYQSYDSSLQEQLIDIAEATGSFIDEDDDGAKDDPAVLYGSWNWPAIELVIEALWDMAEEMDQEISFQVAEDPNGWITAFWPDVEEVYTIERGESVTYGFELSTAAPTLPDDQFYHARVEILDDGQWVDETDIWVVIRPETVH